MDHKSFIHKIKNRTTWIGDEINLITTRYQNNNEHLESAINIHIYTLKTIQSLINTYRNESI